MLNAAGTRAGVAAAFRTARRAVARGVSAFCILHSAFVMKLGTVIGRVTLAKTVKALEGGRFLVVSPFSREQFEAGL